MYPPGFVLLFTTLREARAAVCANFTIERNIFTELLRLFNLQNMQKIILVIKYSAFLMTW